MGLKTLIRNWLQVEKSMVKFNRSNFICADSTVLYETAIILPQRGKDSICIGEKSHIRGHLITFPHGGSIKIGNQCYIAESTRIWSGCDIKIGDNVLISHNVNIFDDTTHPINYIERREHVRQIFEEGFPKTINSLKPSPIVIGNDAWICCNSIILRGVMIGEGAIVSAGSVVTKNVEPYTVVAGNPAVVIKKLEH